ncbi:UxaA family hydrolase [Enterovibrio norvegicus]|uniref:UxaA family hydrolase n=1 Tax=Enterovibrio norvegicus TaxID=188144 RepID=UPI0013D47019|nr:UxaA family hydrolase [Enterovibrio norvegicus]
MKYKARDFLLLKDVDNVLVTCRNFLAGEYVDIDGESVSVDQDTPAGYKIARFEIENGELIVKCGMTIGECTKKTAKGSQLHIHNMDSLYIASHLKGGARYG